MTAILSNGSPSMLADVVAAAKLDGLLDHVWSVEEVGVFKTHPRVYQLAVDRLGVPRERHLLPVLQRLGRARGLRLRHARGVVQPLRPAPRAPAGRPGPRGPLARRAPRPPRPRVSRPRCHSRERGAQSAGNQRKAPPSSFDARSALRWRASTSAGRRPRIAVNGEGAAHSCPAPARWREIMSVLIISLMKRPTNPKREVLFELSDVARSMRTYIDQRAARARHDARAVGRAGAAGAAGGHDPGRAGRRPSRSSRSRWCA